MDFDWNKGVWNLNVAPKIKLFLWKTFLGALPVGERLISRNIAGDPKCTRCGLTESIYHLLFQYEFAQRIWALAPINPTVEDSRLIDFPVNWTNLMGLTCLPRSVSHLLCSPHGYYGHSGSHVTISCSTRKLLHRKILFQEP